MSPTMKELLRTTLADEEPAIPAGAAVERAIARARRDRRQRFAIASGAIAAVAASAVAAVTLWPDGAPVTNDLATPSVPRLTLPAAVDLTSAAPLAPDAQLRMIFQTAGDTFGTPASYGLTTTGDVVRLPDLPTLPTSTTGDWRISLGQPAQMSADGTRLLVQKTDDAWYEDPAPLLFDTRTGREVPVPWKPEYRAAGLSPDGSSLAVVTFAGDVNDGIFERPWHLVIVNVATGAERAVEMPEVISRTDSVGAIPPIWSSNGDTLRLGVARPGGMVDLLVSLAPEQGSIIDGVEFALGTAPWSPDGDRLVTTGTSPTAFRIVNADPASPELGARLAAGPTQSRALLGWSGSEHLLWFDLVAQNLVETDLSGMPAGAAIPISADSPVIAMVIRPSSVGR